MNPFIVPGVRLLNRLRLRGKFALLSLFILLPIVMASGLLAAERQAEKCRGRRVNWLGERR